MVKVEVERTYVCDLSRVFKVFTDHAGWTDWAGMGRVVLVREGAPSQDGVGCIREFQNPGVAVREEVVTFEMDKRMVYRLLDPIGLSDHRGEVSFHDIGGGRTRIHWRAQFEPAVGALAWPMKQGVALVFRRVLRRLTRVLS